jgi:hypothetical protein
MEITGTVVDQATGNAIPNVTIWEIAPDGRSAEIVGYSDMSGKYDVFINNQGSTINYVTDGYTGLTLPASQVLLSDQVLLQKDGSVSAKLTLSGIPAWVWLVLAGLGIFFIGDGKRKHG